jgi:hypothetical protein
VPDDPGAKKLIENDQKIADPVCKQFLPLAEKKSGCAKNLQPA